MDDDFWLEAIFKNHEKSSFFEIFLMSGYPQSENEQNWAFWRCFKTCSSHHKLSSKVCKIVLRACRNVFWWKITFWNTSGHIIGHNVTCSKSSKSPLCFYHFWEFWILEKNHDFDDDFELVTWWPIIWPEVFQNVISTKKHSYKPSKKFYINWMIVYDGLNKF